MRIHDVIVKPVITEKGLSQGAQGLYVFEVNLKANKHMIKEAVEKLFNNVTVSSVRTVTTEGKKRRVGRRMMNKKSPNVKKAYVHLSKGKIDIIPNSQ